MQDDAGNPGSDGASPELHPSSAVTEIADGSDTPLGEIFLLRLLPGFPYKFVPFRYDVVGSFEEIAPDPGWLDQLGERSSERLNGQPTVVSARLDRSKDGLEVDVTAPRYTAIVV
jgi:hypothetical protein